MLHEKRTLDSLDSLDQDGSPGYFITPHYHSDNEGLGDHFMGVYDIVWG